MKTYSLYFVAFLSLIFLSGCVDDDDLNPVDPTVELNVPATYSFERDGASTVSFSGQSDRIAMAEELASGLMDTDKSLDDLNNMFRNPEGVDPFAAAELNESTKALRSKVAAGAALYGQDAVQAAAIREDFDGWIAGQVNDVFPAWNELAAAGQAGQIADGSSTRYVNSWGLEYNQAFAKGLIGALMVDQINNNYLSALVLDDGSFRADNDAGITAEGSAYTDMEHRWDEAFGYLFGASATPATPLLDLEEADNFLNKYLGRVEGDEDYTGIAADIEEAFRTGRQAIVQKEYTQRDTEAAKLQDNLEDIIAIRAVYYLKQGEAALRAQPVQRGTAFHDLSEGYGFVYSLRFLRTRNSDAIVDWYEVSEDLITRLRNAGGNGWWDIDPDVLAELAQEIADATGINVTEAGN